MNEWVIWIIIMWHRSRLDQISNCHNEPIELVQQSEAAWHKIYWLIQFIWTGCESPHHCTRNRLKKREIICSSHTNSHTKHKIVHTGCKMPYILQVSRNSTTECAAISKCGSIPYINEICKDQVGTVKTGWQKQEPRDRREERNICEFRNKLECKDISSCQTTQSYFWLSLDGRLTKKDLLLITQENVQALDAFCTL